MNVSALIARLGSPRPTDPWDRVTTPAPVPVDWDAVEDWLGLRLPADYKELVSARGPLDIGEFLWLHAPCAQGERFDYGDWLWETHRACRISSRQAPPYEPPPFHPAPGGLLAWGETRGGGHLFWDTGASDDPDRWPVVVYDQDAVRGGNTPWRNWGMPLVETVAALLDTGLPLPGGADDRTLGPLPATARRTAFLTDARPWTPPEPDPEAAAGRVSEAVRRAALTEGGGLEALTRLVPSPEAPVLGDGGWEEVFEALGTRLPTEYVALMNRYGGGAWMRWLRFDTPLGKGERSLLHRSRETADIYRELRADFPEFHPLAVWPEPGGFLPFADTVDGDHLGWLTVGEPDDWPLVVWPRHADQGPPLSGNLTDTLLEWLRGRFGTAGLPRLDVDDDPLRYARFEPWEDASQE
ncbi:SMI1/KNR4 family protein [Streptomyces macrosporus]|uniref:Knr4/Smi1-like domain-containing protein n=1 Tax=Streptomyces macrosporus TaxID=44032 RepID=A0ABN3JV19_9ACTN